MTDQDYMTQLNEQQQAAVGYLDGPSLVIAGAGSGKTRVLTYKIVHLLYNQYEPWRILALTFTNKAAREMRERIEGLVGQQIASKLWMGTFHSIFARILRINAERIGFKRDFTIYDAADSKSLVKSIIKDMGLDDKIYKPSTVLNSISAAKNALMSPEDYAADRELMEADKRGRRPLTQQIYQTYRNRCFVAGAMDFDDLLYYTNILLRDNADIRHHYREYFRYVLVDEYQDTNFAQHAIVSQLTEGLDNLCVVGDDAQSIYSFRGANIRNILNLKRNYPNLRIFKLEQNYRSTQNIINAANSLIAKNKEQIPKNVFSNNDVGERVEVVQSYSDYEESFLVANRISQVKMSSHDSYEEFAVLYRTNAQSRILEESLRKRNIPYRIYGGLSFYQRKEVKDAIAYFRLSINPADDEALKRVINYPGRGIGETTVNKLLRRAIEDRVSIWEVITDLDNRNPGLNSGTVKKLNGFRALIEDFIKLNQQGLDAETVATAIIRDTGMMSMLLTDNTPESISRKENLNELINGAREFVAQRTESGQGDEVTLRDFLGEVSLATDQDTQDTSEERVTLMTVHAAKGLEFSNVFVVGVEDDLFPSAMSKDSPQAIEEERRLLYVALTRAKKFCMMSYATSRYRNGQTQQTVKSPFLRDIDRQYLKLATGTSLDDRGQAGINPLDRYRSSYHSPSAPASRGGYGRGAGASYGSGGYGSRESRSQTSPRSIFTSAPPAAASGGGGFTLHSPAELTSGMNIEHPRFGKGTIISIDTQSADARIVVMFNNVETKTLLLKFAKFNIL